MTQQDFWRKKIEGVLTRIWDDYLSITLFNKKVHSPKFSRIRTFGGNSSLPQKDEQDKSIQVMVFVFLGSSSCNALNTTQLCRTNAVRQTHRTWYTGYPAWSSCNTHNTTRLDHRLAQSKHSAGTLCTWRLIPELRAGWCWRGQLVPTMGFRVTKHSRLGVDIVFVHPPCISLYYCENILSNVADINILGLCPKIQEDD